MTLPMTLPITLLLLCGNLFAGETKITGTRLENPLHANIATGGVDFSTITTAIDLKLSSPTVAAPDGWVLTQTDGNPTWQPAPSQSGLTYMFVSSASDISGYQQMVSASNFFQSPRSTATSITNPAVGAYISTWVTNIGYPGTTFFPSGPWNIHLHLRATALNKFKVKTEVYIRDAGGINHEWLENMNETPTFLTTTEAEYNFTGIGVSTNIPITSRLVVRVKVTAFAGGGTNEIQIFTDGSGLTQTNSRLEGPSVAASVSNFVPYAGATQQVNTGVYGITMSSDIVAHAFYGAATGLTAIPSASIDPSSITKQGNTFNAASKLVQLDSNTKLPAVDGSQLTNLPSTAGGAVLASTQTFTGANTFTSSVTITDGGKQTTFIVTSSSTLSGVSTILPNYGIWADIKTPGTDAGTSTSGSWYDRTLNSEIDDTGNIGVVSGGVTLTLIAGTYFCEWSVPSFGATRNQTRLYNFTDSATIQSGTSEYGAASNGAKSFGMARFTISASKAIRLMQRVDTGVATVGLGVASNFAESEIYSLIKCVKER